MSPAPAGLVILVGMAREARIAGPGASLRRIPVTSKPAAILSFGLCGALDPALRPGDLIIGTAVGGIRCDEAWTARLGERLPEARLGPVASEGGMAVSVAAKRALRARGAVAVDMESHLAAATGVPFAILRAVSDGASAAIPEAAQAGFGEDGVIDARAVLRSLAKHPGQIGALIRTALGAEAGFRALARCAVLLRQRRWLSAG